MGHAVLQPLRVGLSRVPHIWIRVFLRDQPYGVVIEPLIRGSVDAVRQHCPAKRLTPMGLLRVEVRRNDVISGGQSAVLHSKFIRSGGRVKHIKASP